MVRTGAELLPDRGLEAARQALAAARAVRVFDGRATAWTLVLRVLEVLGLVLVLRVMAGGTVLNQHPVWWSAVGFVLALGTGQSPLARLSGAEPSRWPDRARGAVVTLGVVVFLLLPRLDTSTTEILPRSILGVLVVVGVAYLLAPVIRWSRSRSRERGAAPWPEGAEAYAVLSVLARARWVYPDRLATLIGLSPERADEWIAACAERGLVRPGRRRTILARGAELTPHGRVVLDAWTSELTRRASTSDVALDRS